MGQRRRLIAESYMRCCTALRPDPPLPHKEREASTDPPARGTGMALAQDQPLCLEDFLAAEPDWLLPKL